MTDKYKKGTGNKELSWEGIYKEFSTKFWLKPDLRNHQLFEDSPPVSRPVTPASSRPVTSTLPSFSQNANVITVTINYGAKGKSLEKDE
ncbi:hypothetical protein RirG_183170 [Rhizophagus irregularis DAOM 197198w]|uniref:Uncharacterized protein n=2 Tax=Rhizophagus irregularis TaxID=588596 RepID=A0A015JYC6_RHIIW|nr:hypothetical protein RirG_183170 [Rhizophagus irregularis DAOM 197198w]